MSTNYLASTWCFVLVCSGLSNFMFVEVLTMSLDIPEAENNQLLVSKAQINLTFREPLSGKLVTETEFGRYAVASPIHPESGRLVHVVTEEGENHGCNPVVNGLKQHWIALVRRGGCKFHDKVLNALVSNASAVIVYNYVEEDDLLVMNHYIDNVVSVFIHKADGERLAELVDAGITVHINISLEEIVSYDIRDTVTGRDPEPYKVQPLLIISVSLISCLIAALSALLIYGIRRTKLQHKKSRRHIVFAVNDTARHRLIRTETCIPETVLMEPNNNDPNHNVYNVQS